MQPYTKYNDQLTYALNKKQGQVIAVFSRKNYAIGFTFQTTSKDFIN